MKIINILPFNKLTPWNHEDLVGLFKRKEGNKQASKKARTWIARLHFWPCYVHENNTTLNTTTPRTLTSSCSNAQPPHFETTWRASFWPVAMSLVFIPRTASSCLCCDFLVWWLSLSLSSAKMIFDDATQRLIMFHNRRVQGLSNSDGSVELSTCLPYQFYISESNYVHFSQTNLLYAYRSLCLESASLARKNI